MHIVSLVLCGRIIPLYDRVRLLGVFIRQPQATVGLFIGMRTQCVCDIFPFRHLSQDQLNGLSHLVVAFPPVDHETETPHFSATSSHI